MKNNEKECVQKRWKKGEPFINHVAFTQHLEKEVEKETPDNMSNEASEYSCAFCGCDHCGQPMLLRECSMCGSTLCGCHFMPEEHDCVAVPFSKGWNEYAMWQEKLNAHNI